MLTPISKGDYLVLVRSNAVCKDDDLTNDVKSCLPSDDREQSLRSCMEAFCFDPELGRSGLLQIFPLEQAKEALDRPEFKTENWHYDRTAGVLLINLEMGVHEHLSAALYKAYKEPNTPWRIEQCAEQFIESGLGWFKSSSSYGRALKGKDVKLTFQETAVFGSNFMLMK